MFPESIEPIKQGDTIKASWLNRLRDAAAKALNIKAEAPLEAIRTAGGWIIRFATNPWGYFWIRILSGAEPYAWQEAIPASGGTWQVGSKSGTLAIDPAWEQNGNTSVPIGVIVVARRALSSGTIIFQLAPCSTNQPAPHVTPGFLSAPPTNAIPPLMEMAIGSQVSPSFSGRPGGRVVGTTPL